MPAVHYWAGLLSTGFLMLLSLCTLLFFRRGTEMPLVIPALVSCVTFLPFFLALRYRLPVFDPYLAVLGAYALFRIGDRAVGGARRGAGGGGSGPPPPAAG
jgi:hydrogenase/urease accessory protein HupE